VNNINRVCQGRIARILVRGFSLPSLHFPSPSFPRFPFPNPARGSGERHKLHQQGPSANAFWGYFEVRKRFWWQFLCSFSGDKM